MAAKKIQYSVTMRPNPIHEGDPMKAYANIQLAGHYTTEDLCEHVISHNGTYTEGTVTGVLTDMVKCIRELLLQGYSIQVGALGRLEPTQEHGGHEHRQVHRGQYPGAEPDLHSRQALREHATRCQLRTDHHPRSSGRSPGSSQEGRDYRRLDSQAQGRRRRRGGRARALRRLRR